MEEDNRVITLCQAGIAAEFAGRTDEAAALYRQAWEAASAAGAGDYEACVAAHYLARVQARPEDGLRWNLEALRRAEAAGNGRVAAFMPSLYLSLGHSYEQIGDLAAAAAYYEKAAALGVSHRHGYPGPGRPPPIAGKSR